jgi:hypothetical protein
VQPQLPLKNQQSNIKPNFRLVYTETVEKPAENPTKRKGNGHRSNKATYGKNPQLSQTPEQAKSLLDQEKVID